MQESGKYPILFFNQPVFKKTKHFFLIKKTYRHGELYKEVQQRQKTDVYIDMYKIKH